jgi:hypothetical protein
MCIILRNIYLKFEGDTLKGKEVLIFLKEISEGDKSEKYCFKSYES